MNKGGARPGAGRKPKADEERARGLCIQAIEAKYGSIEKGLIALLDSDEPSLRRFVFEHAIGKPKETLSLDNPPVTNVYKFMIPKNGRELAEEAIKATNGNGNGHHS